MNACRLTHVTAERFCPHCGSGPLGWHKRMCEPCRDTRRRAAARRARQRLLAEAKRERQERGRAVYLTHPAGRKATPEDRFTVKIDVDRATGCWMWRGSIMDRGYPQFWDGRVWRAHRWAYEHWVGPIPAGLTLDHLCKRKVCVNPAHLEPVTFGENFSRYLRERA